MFLVGSRATEEPFGHYHRAPFERVEKPEVLVEKAVASVPSTGLVFVVYCGAHGPPDPQQAGARALVLRLRLRAVFGDGLLRVYEIGGPPRAPR